MKLNKREYGTVCAYEHECCCGVWKSANRRIVNVFGTCTLIMTHRYSASSNHFEILLDATESDVLTIRNVLDTCVPLRAS